MPDWGPEKKDEKAKYIIEEVINKKRNLADVVENKYPEMLFGFAKL